MNEPDEDLQELFARQREVDRTCAPGFYAMRARVLADAPASRPIALWRWGLLTATALGLLFATLLRPVSAPKSAPRTAPTSYDALARELDRAQASLNDRLMAQSQITAWQSPTDFLLHHPPQNNP
jgi:hypothetical protein